MDELITEQEVEALILSLAEGQPTFTEEEAMLVIKWAEKVRIDNALLNNVLNGLVKTSIKEGEVYFQINEAGKSYVENVVGEDDNILDTEYLG